jgi:hypothetical protein
MKRICYPAITICLLICIGTLYNCKKEEKDLPSLITVIISSVTKDSALLGGLIINDGGADITARGVCYGTVPSPKISGTKTINGRGKGTFISYLTGLTPNTLYYARAYATNSEGTGYGNEITFETMPGIVEAPFVVTLFPENSFYYADVTGRVTYDGGAPIAEKGICWSTGKNPTIYDNNIIYTGNIFQIDRNYDCRIDSLQPDSYYYTRAYAINSVDTSYGNIVTIKTLAVPEVSTINATEITKNSALVSGNVITLADASNGIVLGYEVDIEIGISYGTDKDPSIEGQHIKSDTKVAGEFKCILTNLMTGVLYHARSYVRWGNKWSDWDGGELVEEWIVYGNEITFRTSE